MPSGWLTGSWSSGGDILVEVVESTTSSVRIRPSAVDTLRVACHP